MTTTVYTIQKRDVRRRPRARNTRTVPAGIEQTWHCTSLMAACAAAGHGPSAARVLSVARCPMSPTTNWSDSPGSEAISWKPVIAWLKRHEHSTEERERPLEWTRLHSARAHCC